LLDQGSNVLATDNHGFTYQSGSSGTQSGDGTYQSDDGSYQSESAGVNEILLENPIANAHLYGWETLSVSLQYAFDESGYSSPRWSYKINEDFYSTQSSATEVNGYQVDGWLEGLNSGYHTIYVALLDPLGGDQILAQDNSIFNFSKPNSAPTNLFLSNNTVEENVPDSSIVGVFSATDADGDDLHYHFYNLGESPEILSGFKAYYYEREFTENGTQHESGRAYFYDTNVSHRADNEEEWEEEGYVYEKTGPSTGILSLSNGTWVAELTFDEHKRGTGEWTETIEQETLNGSIEINFEKIGESPDSLVGLQGNFYQNPHQHLESFTITVGEYTLENGEYIYSGVDRNITTNVHCDVFSLSADSDEHNESAHTHYYAVSNAWYDRYSKTLNWTDYGPAIDEATVEEMCQMGSGGTYKSASSESYTQDGEIYLKIISVESNQPWFEDYRIQGNLMEINGTTLTFSSWNEELEIEERETKEYVYEKTGTETGVLSFNDGSVDVELTFNAYGDGHGEWHIESTEGNVSGWSGIHLWNYGFEDPHHSNPSVRFWMEGNGTLRTQGTIDYESVQASVGIIVTADDGRGGSVSEQFEITILDVFEDLDEDGIEDHLDEDNDNDGFSDEEEYANGTDPLDANSWPNRAPHTLVLSNNEVSENQPEGTVVGVLSATDPDEDQLQYSITVLGESPESLNELSASYHDKIFTEQGEEYESGEAKFSDLTLESYNTDSSEWETEEYHYEKTGPSTATLKLNQGAWVAKLVFDEHLVAKGEWTESDGTNIWNGFVEIIFQKVDEPHVSGAESENTYGSPLFLIDQDGMLRTTTPLDFETDPTSVGIIARASDPSGAFIEEHFTIHLTNVVEDLDEDDIEDYYDEDDDGDGFGDEIELELGFDHRNSYNRPELAIAQTLTASLSPNGNYMLRGKLLASGGVQLSNLGFEITGDGFGYNHLLYVDTNVSESSEFSLNLDALTPGETFTYRAYASNIAGTSLGAPRKFTVERPEDWWYGADELDGGWKSNWIGVFLPQPNGWAYHTDLGWAFISPDSNAGIWFWVEGDGWHWTRDGIWPFMWSNTTSDWLYIMKSGGRTFIYDYSTESFISDF